MCTASAECKKQATLRLLLPGTKRKAKETFSASAKRSKTGFAELRYEMYKNCLQAYDITENSRASCVVHPGADWAVEVDSDFFADGNDMTYGESTNENTGWTQDWRFKEFPEGFTWTCCNGKGDKPPCIVAKHIASESAGDVVKMSSAGDED
ncbi:hypothetical protein CLAFUW4_05623 [Fulvia fulva]|uniref:Uncharacterized protein n=1 Tax=Passalora fulva TaxID=5499 RepID=A0A9Q8LGY4_PASFU|nr:uncharacterized protein CLAFUR5_05764 [Fulvia fulva]KAK4624172.1 hypothetical protein CLAFUR4_05618 [Fulvia fulva]KAK4625912.1 hypothetical protein CLAFUR0_05626 [Fulvia fulva]UJO17202.1 hypothetical protein CLAFUR5_05764 [Fulvia fulva]WPV14817.1 hypothetical protein CLAFUW4_05623 [Fulvia fulva]WPV29797.1 hypothetical protein CLAFUW7_05622 [Fulvia fulva]